MSTWYCKDVSDGDEAYGPVRDTFDILFKHAKFPRDMAVFYIYDSAQNTAKIYLSPACRPMALAIDAAPCDQPDPNRLNLLYGHYDAWGIVFPDHDRTSIVSKAS